MHSQSDPGARVVVGAALCVLALPVLWVFSVSVQPPASPYQGGFSLLPSEVTFDGYLRLILENHRGMRDAMAFSVVIVGVSTVIAMMLALSAVYVVRVFQTSGMAAQSTRNMIFGLFFLPPFAVFPAYQLSEIWLPWAGSSVLQLVFHYVLTGFVFAFMLLYIIFAKVSDRVVEETLIQTKSRWLTFRFAMFKPELAGVLAVAMMTFAALWNDFLVPSLIAGAEALKPFSVVLQTFREQRSTDFSTFAAGALLSMLLSLLVPFLLFLVGVLVVRLLGRARWLFRFFAE